MSLESNKAVVLREIDFWNGHDAEKIDEVYADDYVGHEINGSHGGSRDQVKQGAVAIFAAFPDVHLTADAIIAEGDKVVKLWTGRMTHKAEYMGIPATGKEIVVTGCNVFRIVDDKIAECWAHTDSLSMMQQLGVIPPMG
ncbi:MAG TPA: ester cyclase [Dehalococcoidia bacterium]|nr:ester cyclase [Dehalococcoidia bacterium]